jgi:tetratricopeptide (TPR) repeat protein
MMTQPATYAPSIRWRLIRVGVPVLLLLLAITAYVLLNAETFERNADPDSISIPVFLILIWGSVSALAFVPLLLIGGTQLVIAPDGFAFGSRLKGVYLKVEGAWDDILSAEYEGVELHTGGVYVNRVIFGLRVRQPNGEQFISLHHYRDQLRPGGRLADHLKQVAPRVYAAIAQTLITRTSVPVANAPDFSELDKQVAHWTTQAAQAHQAGNHRAEAEAYRQAVAITPRNHDLYFYLANALIQSRQPDAAIEVMQQGLQVRPTSSTLAFNIALTARSIGQTEQARTYFERALALAAADPDLSNRNDFIKQIRTQMTTAG